MVDLYSRHMARPSAVLDFLVQNINGFCFCVSPRTTLSSLDTHLYIKLNVVQRWYSGMFGVETLSWWDSHSAVEIWKNNKNMLKQKYRMHNLYVQVSYFSN